MQYWTLKVFCHSTSAINAQSNHSQRKVNAVVLVTCESLGLCPLRQPNNNVATKNTPNMKTSRFILLNFWTFVEIWSWSIWRWCIWPKRQYPYTRYVCDADNWKIVKLTIQSIPRVIFFALVVWLQIVYSWYGRSEIPD